MIIFQSFSSHFSSVNAHFQSFFQRKWSFSSYFSSVNGYFSRKCFLINSIIGFNYDMLANWGYWAAGSAGQLEMTLHRYSTELEYELGDLGDPVPGVVRRSGMQWLGEWVTLIYFSRGRPGRRQDMIYLSPAKSKSCPVSKINDILSWALVQRKPADPTRAGVMI